jgi:hypothetical protein
MYLHCILLELLKECNAKKNAMQATTEKHFEAGGYPPLTVSHHI